MTGQPDRPDADGQRTLKAVVHAGRVYLDMASLTEGFRARADAIEAQGSPTVAALYRREADELDTAAIGWLSSTDPPRMPPPDRLELAVPATQVATARWALGDDGITARPLTLSGVTPDGHRVVVAVRPDVSEQESWLQRMRREGTWHP